MEMHKQDIPDTLWIGFGRKDAPIIQQPSRFKDYFYTWMHPHKYKIKHVEFWPGFSWGTVKLESREARNALLEHVLRKPFRPDNETGWVLNKFEKCTPLPNLGDPDSSPKRSPSKKNAMKDALAKKKVVEILRESKTAAAASNKKGRKSRSSTASPATVNNGLVALLTQHDVLDLEDLPPLEPMETHHHRRTSSKHQHHSMDDDEDDSELRVKANVSKVIPGVRVVEAVTKKHGVYKLSINDIVGASKYKPDELKGAEIVIVLGPLKKNQRRRDFLWAELSENWKGPSPDMEVKGSDEDEVEEDDDPVLVKEEALENAMVNLKRFYKWSIKNQHEAERQIRALQEEVANAPDVQAKVAIISDHLTLASHSFTLGTLENDDDSIEELITSTRCSSAFSDMKRAVSNVEYDNRDNSVVYRKSDIEDSTTDNTVTGGGNKADMDDNAKLVMQDLAPTDECSVSDFNNPRNILNLEDSPVPQLSSKSHHHGHQKLASSHGGGGSNANKVNVGVYDLPTSRQTIKANASTYTVESSADISIDMIYWQKMLNWLTIHHFDHHGDTAKDHAKWVVIVWELAGITPTNLKSEIIGHQQTIPNFCTRLAEILEAKKAKIPFWNNLSISNVIHATLCYLLSREFPADEVPKCMAVIFGSIPYYNSKTASVFQMRGYVDKYITDEKGLLMSPKGYVLFHSNSIKHTTKEDEKNAPIGTHVLFNASKVEEIIAEDGAPGGNKKVKYLIANNVWVENEFQIFHNDLAKKINSLQSSAMAKVLHRANSNLSDEAILSMYEDGLSKIGKDCPKLDLKNLMVEKKAMATLQPLVDFLRTRLELRLDMASNISLMYASMWSRIGYDLDYLMDDFHTLHAVGSRGCVTYNWEKLLLNFKLPNCLEIGRLIRETVAFLNTTAATKKVVRSIDLTDGKSLYEVAIKRTRVDRHHQLLKGAYESELWVPQPFQRARLLEAVLRPRSSFPEDDHLLEEDEGAPVVAAAGAAVSNGPTPSPFPAAGKGKTAQEVKVHPEGETVMTFETNLDGNLDEDIVDAVIKGTIAFKYRIKDNVWRIISKNDGVYSCPPDGWGDREYIPIKKQCSQPKSPTKTPLTPANSISVTPINTTTAITPDGLLFDQIRQQFTQLNFQQEQYNNLLQAQQQQQHPNVEQNGNLAASANFRVGKAMSLDAGNRKVETTEELLQRHGFR